MKLTKAKLVKIVIENDLTDKLIKDLKTFSIKGYTIKEAKGEGLNNKNFDHWSGGNSSIEIIVREEKALKILEMLNNKYIGKYSCIVYLSDVEVLREEKFS